MKTTYSIIDIDGASHRCTDKNGNYVVIFVEPENGTITVCAPD